MTQVVDTHFGQVELLAYLVPDFLDTLIVGFIGSAITAFQDSPNLRRPLQNSISGRSKFTLQKSGRAYAILA